MNEEIGINQRACEYESTSLGGRTILIHRKVWIEHYGEIPNGYMIHHKDGNKKNNNIDNLQLVTRKEHGELHKKIKKG